MNGIEFQFVKSWEEWDEVETMCLQFYKCVLQPDIATLVGSDFAEIVLVDCQTCTVQFYVDEPMEGSQPSPLEFKFTASISSKEDK